MAPVVFSVMCVLASAAVLRREEDPPGGLRSHGRSGRFTPFAPIAHSGPSHRFLRPRFAGTCLRRAPPPPLARGCASPREGLPPPPYRCRCLIFDFSVALPCLPLHASTCNTLAALTGNRHSVHSACQRGKHFGENGAKPGRVDRKMPFCAFCVSTRQWLSWLLV